MEQPVVVTSIAAGGSIRRLDELKLVFSEPVVGADRRSAYVLGGDGIGTLSIEQVRVVSNTTIILQFSGIPSDGEIQLQIRGVNDIVGNTLSNSLLVWQGDGLPKWRYLGRKLSRGLISVNQIPIALDNEYLYVAYSDESCQQNYGYYDGTLIRVHLPTKVVDPVGEPCIINSQYASANIQSLVLVDGKPVVAFRDSSTLDSNKISVKRWNTTSWEYLGLPRFTPNALSPELYVVGNVLYCSFRDATSTPANRLRIYSFNLAEPNANWQEVQNLLLSNNNVFTKTTLQQYSDKLFFAFRDGSTTLLSVRYYDTSTSNYSSILNLSPSFSSLDTTVHLTDHPAQPVVAFSYRPFNTNIALYAYDGDTWAATNWVAYVPATFDLGTTSAANHLQCRFRSNQPFCTYVEGSGFIYTVTYIDSWQHVKSPGAPTSAINGGNPSLLVTPSALYLAIRDKEVGYTNTLSLLSYE